MDLTHASRVNEPHACWARVQLRSRADFSKWHVVQADATAPRDNGMVYLCASYDWSTDCRLGSKLIDDSTDKA